MNPLNLVMVRSCMFLMCKRERSVIKNGDKVEGEMCVEMKIEKR